MTTLYAKLGPTPLCALLLALAGCGPATDANVVDVELAALEAWAPTATPQDAANAFITAWNGGQRGGVLRVFDPDRRRTIARAPELNARMQVWRALSVDVPLQCNPRGAFFKTARVLYEDRRSGAPIEEIVWLHLKDGGWWLYSL